VTTKLNVNKIIDAMKDAAKLKKIETALSKKPLSVNTKPPYRERNMMQEAIDMGSHNAGEIFKDVV